MTPTTPTPTLDFAQVRQRCPKAFEKLRNWLISTPIPRDWDMRDGQLRHAESRQRDLYDFFDEQGVYVVLDTLIRSGQRVYYGYISVVRQDLYTVDYPTRAAAEAAAFTSAFEKLEGLLTKKEEN